MKRQITIIAIIIFLCILFVLQLPRSSQAVVSGDCDACHGLYPQMKEEVVPGNILCVNCHSNTERDTIKIIGGARVPVVYNTVEPSKYLAGGNFYYVAKDHGDRKGHNVDGITSADAKFTGIPPGYDSASDPSVIGYNPKGPLACAGSNGCHGNRNVENPFAAISGAHHREDSPVDGSTIAKSYRYLKNTDKVKGVEGLEDEDWGYDSSSKKHNEYSPTIDNLCASCHGDFHSRDKIGRRSPWFRHPTGVILPSSGEYMNYNPADIGIYSLDAPVARSSIPKAASEAVKPGTDIVICLSCHMAHAGPHEFILRWDYDAIVSGEKVKGGCFICHTGKGE